MHGEPASRSPRRVPVHRWEFYGVHRRLWTAAVPEDATAPRMSLFLCIGCLEQRIGRRLTPDDSPSGGLNVPGGSRRLDQRLGFIYDEEG